MNKKPGLLFTVSLLAIIILAVSFDMNFGGLMPVRLPKGINPDDILYVCQIKNSAWIQVSQTLQDIRKYVHMFIAFMGIILLFSWGWALYQNLLKDKFSEDVYKNPWGLTKITFWMIIIFTVLIKTPDYFRRVEVKGHGNNWVLCENTSKDAQAVRFQAVQIP